MTEPTKCAHPACSCMVAPGSPYGKYCSETCKKKGNGTELRCDCHHQDCR